MAVNQDNIYETKGETFTEKPIMVTIALAEYRSLVEENARLIYENTNANNEINRLYDKNKKLLNGGDEY